MTKHIALNLEARYAWAKTDVDETQQVGMTVRKLGDTINLYAAFLAAGFKFYF